jgi:hypothetical protein
LGGGFSFTHLSSKSGNHFGKGDKDPSALQQQAGGNLFFAFLNGAIFGGSKPKPGATPKPSPDAAFEVKPQGPPVNDAMQVKPSAPVNDPGFGVGDGGLSDLTEITEIKPQDGIDSLEPMPQKPLPPDEIIWLRPRPEIKPVPQEPVPWGGLDELEPEPIPQKPLPPDQIEWIQNPRRFCGPPKPDPFPNPGYRPDPPQ